MAAEKLGRSWSAVERGCNAVGGCPSMCGMCPSCAFAPKPPGSSRRLWEMSNSFKRRFLVELILRCKSIQLLEQIQSMLGVTPWPLLTRARSPASPQDYPHRRAASAPALDGRPEGIDTAKIWDWFSRSPDGMKSRYLSRLFSRCDWDLLRMVANLTSVLLVRQKRGFLQCNVNTCKIGHDQDSDDDTEDPALMVVPGSLRSVSGVSRYRDIIGCLPDDLSKRILSLLDMRTLKRCGKVCQYWQHLAQESMEEIKIRGVFQGQIDVVIARGKSVNMVSPVNIIEVPVPVSDDEEVDIPPSDLKGKPFEAAYAEIKTKTVQMEERNVYCCVYFETVLLGKEDPHRVMDYRGGCLMAMGSKDCAVHLFYVGSKTAELSLLKGHVGSIRAVLLCKDRDLVITASCDASIRCWNVKTDKCVMSLYGHAGTVNCLDVHADRLVSGAKDCLVKVWSLHTGKQFEQLKFKHPSSVQCVRISTTVVYSSCDRGLVKIWDMRNASLLRVIDSHRNSVKCLFFDEWHLLSGDTNGQVMAWSINCDTKQSLMTFNHPKEVRSLTLAYLRVVTGCADGNIRVFNFLTGDCLREITAEEESGRILSVHFHDNSMLVNATSGVKLYHFAGVYKESTERGQGETSSKSTAPLRELPLSPVRVNRTVSPSKKRLHDFKAAGDRKPKQSIDRVALSEKAARERMEKRGLHHPLTRDSILLKLGVIQRAQCIDELSTNMECNARLRDSWGPHPRQPELNLTVPLWHTRGGLPPRARTCVPILRRAVSQSVTDQTRQARRHSADLAHRSIKRVTGFSGSAAEAPQLHERTVMRSLAGPERPLKTGISLPRICPKAPARERGRLRPNLQN